MLRATIGALRRELRAAPASVHAAIRAGLDAWRGWYGEQILDALRRDWRDGRVGPRQARAALTLLRHCPALVLRRAPGRARRAIAWRVSR